MMTIDINNILNWIVKHKLKIIFGLSIIIIDLISKNICWYFLTHEKYIKLLRDQLFIYVMLNMTASNSMVDAMNPGQNMHVLTLAMGALSVIISIYILYIRNVKIKFKFKILIGIGIAFIFYSILLFLFEQVIKIVVFDTHFIAWFSKLLMFSLLITYIKICNNKIPRLIWICSFSAALSNFSGFFISPYYVIDFIYIPGLHKLFNIGVFNFADTILLTCNFLIIIYGVYLLIRKILNRKLKKVSLSNKPVIQEELDKVD
jgi:hypothetical protein